MNRVLKLFRLNGKLSEFNNLSLKIVYGFVATLRLKLDKQTQEKQPPQAIATKGNKIKPQKQVTLKLAQP